MDIGLLHLESYRDSSAILAATGAGVVFVCARGVTVEWFWLPGFETRRRPLR